MKTHCDMDVNFILTGWSQCWGSKPDYLKNNDHVTEYTGPGIMSGQMHGCTGYTHTMGERNMALEFTHSILDDKKTAGLLTRLENGSPVVSPMQSDFEAIKIGDVTGWAPTADTFTFNMNRCSGEHFKLGSSTMIQSPSDGNNEAAIEQLISGEYDALYIYSDQVDNLMRAGNSRYSDMLGLKDGLAYIQTGLNQWSINGTSLAISKRGSGLKNVIDPCIKEIVEGCGVSDYHKVCDKYPTVANKCFGREGAPQFYSYPMDERTDNQDCSTGYCTCNEGGPAV
jgi:hypothetical protein